MATLSDLPPPDSDVRPTLKTIAAATGLAIATVSRALKDAPDIGEDTKRRVRETAALLGYRPNRAGVRLRTGKTNVIALVLSTETDIMNHTSRLIYSIAAALRGTAYHLVVMPFFPDQDPMEPIRYIVETESADGIILNQTKEDDPRIRYMHDHGFPFAAHGRSAMGIDHLYYDFDNESFGRLAARALVERGRQRLFLVAPPRAHTSTWPPVSPAWASTITLLSAPSTSSRRVRMTSTTGESCTAARSVPAPSSAAHATVARRQRRESPRARSSSASSRVSRASIDRASAVEPWLSMVPRRIRKFQWQRPARPSASDWWAPSSWGRRTATPG